MERWARCRTPRSWGKCTPVVRSRLVNGRPSQSCPPRLVGDLAVQQLVSASLEDALGVLLIIVTAVDATWQEKRRAEADQFLTTVRDAIITRLSWDAQPQGAAV